ncbi:SfnB family sulfur acquisition oxidoreductase [Paenibacillus flagellatus]|uniref:SfnB family sulfur acquisition oxidoreductase n=2 Tax=Paenibacillus flagellatus TaxID=2211139 RepID=A0A2V5JZ57_9BACL|nr:SfnB family sulfur acquisition oxidoreductase [Paenibacillus flagellatus]
MRARGFLERDIDLTAATDRTRYESALAIVKEGGVEAPGDEAVSPYAVADVPAGFFTDRKRAKVLSGDEEAIEAAKAYAESIRDGASRRDRYRELPFEPLRRLGESGLLGLVVPKAYGGPGVSTRTLTEVFKLISAADGSLGQIPQNHHFFVKTVELVGTEEQKRFFFGEVLKGAQLGNALAERGIRSLKESRTRIEADGAGGFRLSGSKYYSTGALYAHWIPVTAMDEEDRRVTAFVPRHGEGVEVVDDWTGIGQRTTASGSVILRGVRVPEAHVLPHWRIFEKPQIFSAFGQIMHAAIDVGIAREALADAARFVREKTRPAFKSGYERASDDPDLIRRFGELGIRLHAAEALLEKAAVLIDEAELDLNEETAGKATLAVDSAKYVATEVAIETTNALFEVAGTSSMDRKYNLDRHWRNVRIHTLHDPARLKLHHAGSWHLNGTYHVYNV